MKVTNMKVVKLITRNLLVAMAMLGAIAHGHLYAQVAPGYQTPIPQGIMTPDKIETRLGTLEFFDGFPSDKTVKATYDHLDFMRGVRTFLNTLSIASMHALKEGCEEVGSVNGTVGIFEDLMDSKSLWLTPNTESIYAVTWLDLKDGPIVVESPPNTLGIVDNAWFEYVADLGNVGPDKGKGGKFLFLPPGYEGEVPKGYHTYQSSTYGNLLLWRGFQVKGDPKPAVENIKANARIYPLAKADNPPKQKFINLSGREHNTIHANDVTFYNEINQVIQEEPNDGLDPEILGLLASIGIEKGKEFKMDARMKAILTDAAAVGNGTARIFPFRNRDKEAYLYEGRPWMKGFTAGSHEFMRDGVRFLDERSKFFYGATMITPAMVLKMVGLGSQYAIGMGDADGNPFDGGRTYKLHLPANVPVKNFWSMVLYDNQTRSMLQTDQQFPGLNSERNVKQNKDGSTDLYFGPKAPAGKESNWIQTIPGKGWFSILRLYGPLEAWFDQIWKPDDIVLMKDIPAAKVTGKKPMMATEIPASITTPNKVETRIGTLEFFDGIPTEKTADLLYDNLMFMRGVEAFLNGIPGASLLALRQGVRDVGAGNGDVTIDEGLKNSRSLFLTANTESVYMGTFLDLTNGPMVVESPPNTLGMVNDFFFRYVADLGNAGPDKGKGGKFLFLPPGWEGETPDGYFTYQSPTFGNLLFWRGFLVDGKPDATVEMAKKTIKVYPLASPEERDNMKFINTTGAIHNTVHSNDINFFHEIHTVIDEEPASAFSPEMLGLLVGIGIEKGKPFAPDKDTLKTLKEAAAVGNATARAISFRARDPRAYFFEDSAWFNPFVGGSHEFLRESGARDLDARTMFHYPYTAVTPAMTFKMVGIGSQYAVAAVDKNGEYLDGSKTYQLTMPKGIPAKDFWSFVVYDPQTRSMLQTPRTDYPSLSSQAGDVQPNADGSYTVYFGPEAPEGKESNWIQTVPGKGFFTIMRLYGPLQSWFDQTWRPGEITLVK